MGSALCCCAPELTTTERDKPNPRPAHGDWAHRTVLELGRDLTAVPRDFPRMRTTVYAPTVSAAAGSNAGAARHITASVSSSATPHSQRGSLLAATAAGRHSGDSPAPRSSAAAAARANDNAMVAAALAACGDAGSANAAPVVKLRALRHVVLAIAELMGPGAATPDVMRRLRGAAWPREVIQHGDGDAPEAVPNAAGGLRLTGCAGDSAAGEASDDLGDVEDEQLRHQQSPAFAALAHNPDLSYALRSVFERAELLPAAALALQKDLERQALANAGQGSASATGAKGSAGSAPAAPKAEPESRTPSTDTPNGTGSIATFPSPTPGGPPAAAWADVYDDAQRGRRLAEAVPPLYRALLCFSQGIVFFAGQRIQHLLWVPWAPQFRDVAWRVDVYPAGHPPPTLALSGAGAAGGGGAAGGSRPHSGAATGRATAAAAASGVKRSRDAHQPRLHPATVSYGSTDASRAASQPTATSAAAPAPGTQIIIAHTQRARGAPGHDSLMRAAAHRPGGGKGGVDLGAHAPEFEVEYTVELVLDAATGRIEAARMPDPAVQVLKCRTPCGPSPLWRARSRRLADAAFDGFGIYLQEVECFRPC